MSQSLPKTVIQFILVGGVGFLVDLAGLQGLLWAGFGPIGARLMSFPVAVLVTWMLHRRFTFAHRRSDRRALELTRYLSSQIASWAIGFAVYTTLVVRVPLCAEHPALALAASSIVAAISNYALSHFVVFRSPESTR